MAKANQNASNKSGIIMIIIGGALMILFTVLNSKTSNQSEEEITNSSEMESTSSTEEESTTCGVCGTSFYGNGYDEQLDGSWKELEEPYQGTICSPECGRRNNGNIDNLSRQIQETNTNNADGYNMGSDGRVYENNACGLCNGTGVESGRNLATGEEEGRVCPMCDGRGVKSY